MKKGLVGSLFVVGIFVVMLLVFFLLGGDKGQSNRSDLYPLYYLVPLFLLGAGTLIYLSNKK